MDYKDWILERSRDVAKSHFGKDLESLDSLHKFKCQAIATEDFRHYFLQLVDRLIRLIKEDLCQD